MTLIGPKVLVSPADLPLSHFPPSMQNDEKTPTLPCQAPLNLRTPAYWPIFTERPKFLTGPGLLARVGPASRCVALLSLTWQASGSSYLADAPSSPPFATCGLWSTLGSLAWCTFLPSFPLVNCYLTLELLPLGGLPVPQIIPGLPDLGIPTPCFAPLGTCHGADSGAVLWVPARGW